MTQPHNEDKLNEAFVNSEDVYLIFSVNKSGEYFGYARMESPIVGVAPKPTSDTTSEGETHAPIGPRGQPGDSPAVIPTPATQTAPEGRIIDDSARGTIFWEAKDSTTLDGEESGATNDNRNGNGICEKHFAIRWMSTDRVPFHRTRGMRNPLNHNREVKIARDGTEVSYTLRKIHIHDSCLDEKLTRAIHRSTPALHGACSISSTEDLTSSSTTAITTPNGRRRSVCILLARLSGFS